MNRNPSPLISPTRRSRLIDEVLANYMNTTRDLHDNDDAGEVLLKPDISFSSPMRPRSDSGLGSDETGLDSQATLAGRSDVSHDEVSIQHHPLVVYCTTCCSTDFFADVPISAWGSLISQSATLDHTEKPTQVG